MTAPDRIERDRSLTREEAVATIRRIRAEIVEQTEDLSEAEKAALGDRLSRDIKIGMVERLRSRLDERSEGGPE